MFSAGLPVSSTDETDRHDITEILLKVASNKQTSKIWFPLKLGFMKIKYR